MGKEGLSWLSNNLCHWIMCGKIAIPLGMKTFLLLLLLSSFATSQTLVRCNISSRTEVVKEVGVTRFSNGNLQSFIKNYLGDVFWFSISEVEWVRQDITLSPMETGDWHAFRLIKADENRWVLKKISLSGETSFKETVCF